MATATGRTLTASVNYINSNPPPEVVENGVVTLGEPAGISKEEYKKRRQMTTETHDVMILDARTVEGGLASFSLKDHGITCLKPPQTLDFDNVKKEAIQQEYYPKLQEVVKQATGAKHAFVFQHTKRTENPKSLTQGYAKFAHADSGPISPEVFRGMLVGRFGLPEEEVKNSYVVLVNFWTPFDRPAYKNPLCLLDASTVDVTTERVRVNYAASTTDRRQNQDGGRKATDGFTPSEEEQKKIEELFKAGKTAGGVFADPGLSGPLYAPRHRWIFCPDMEPNEEAWLFTQYDERPGYMPSFHCSFHDSFYDDKGEVPGRRSLECRMVCLFPKQAKL